MLWIPFFIRIRQKWSYPTWSGKCMRIWPALTKWCVSDRIQKNYADPIRTSKIMRIQPELAQLCRSDQIRLNRENPTGNGKIIRIRLDSAKSQIVSWNRPEPENLYGNPTISGKSMRIRPDPANSCGSDQIRKTHADPTRSGKIHTEVRPEEL